MKWRKWPIGVALLSVLAACADPPELPEPPRELSIPANPYGPSEPTYAPQPHRDRPSAIVMDEDRGRFYVALTGSEDAPGRQIAIVDAASFEVRGRIDVGPYPMGLALHPEGRFLVVTNRFARYASIVDLTRDAVVGELDVPFYTEAATFSEDGSLLFLTNRWRDVVLRFAAHTTSGDLALDELSPVPVPDNPRLLRTTGDGGRVLVTSETSLTVSLLDGTAGEMVASHSPNAPVLDAIAAHGYVFVLHTGYGAGHPPNDGFDGDGDGLPGDQTANVTFQDVQNEIDVLSFPELELLHRYTSDTICCKDYRDVDPERPEAGLELAPVDAWPPERAPFMPPRETWIVAGALPERALPIQRADGSPAVAVVFSGDSSVQTFDVDVATGALTARETAATGLYRTGFGAADALVTDDGRGLVVVDRLSETLSEIDLTGSAGPPVRTVVVGDVSGGEFPATDAELGEAFNFVTAAFTVDGDQTCAHCHRDGTPIAKPVSMPLLETPVWGVRLVMSYRGAYDTRPWFVEAAMDEQNFFPVINEFARKENFCCEQSDPRVWSGYPSFEDCSAEPEQDGCNHVLDCLNDPPPECADRGYGGEVLTRDRHFRAAATEVLGREESFGDGLFAERVGADGSIERRPIALSFDGITRALGLFLLSRPRLLPNPNAAVAGSTVDHGRRIFTSSEAGCATCHPLPTGATAQPTFTTEALGPLTFPYVITPNREPTSGLDVDRANPAFLGTFPLARQTDAGLRVGVPSLRGIWDRSLFLHHGGARSLRETLATPGHPILRGSERGFNERDGQANTHGGTSHLSVAELEALIAFVETL